MFKFCHNRAELQFESGKTVSIDFLDLFSNKDPHFSHLPELAAFLFDPVQDLLNGPSKKVRAGVMLASAGLCLQGAIPKKLFKSCQILADVLENLHAGSLIIDDIQDESESRRGQACLHKTLGIHLAINAGSWLYFKALRQIPAAQLDPKIELLVHRLCHETLFRGHLGQALDVGVRIDQVEQHRVPEICHASMTMKSGALMGMATEIGALSAAASPALIHTFRDFGHSFGSILQMFNDLRELSASSPTGNRDLYLHRPSWIWLIAAKTLSPRDYKRLVLMSASLTKADNTAPLSELIKEMGILEIALAMAQEQMHECLTTLSRRLERNGIAHIDRPEWLELLRLSAKVQTSHVYRPE